MRHSDLIVYLQRQQQETPTDLNLAHDLGALCFWAAQHLGGVQQATEYWQRAIANWAMVLENGGFWEDWAGQRSRVYGIAIPEESCEAARQLITERLLRSLAEYDSQMQRTFSADSLELVFHLEVRAIRLLKQTKGLPIGSDADDSLFCGPLMARQLGLNAQVSQLVCDLPEPPGELASLLALFRKLVDDQDRDEMHLFDGQSRRRLMYCFSELGPVLAHIDKGEPHKAVEILATVRCPECGADSTPRMLRSRHSGTLPHVCAGDCPSFAERNPAYALLSDRGELLFRHAVELMAEAHMALAELRIRAEPPDAVATVRHWQDALSAAEVIGIQTQFRDSLVDMALGRVVTLDHKRRLNDAIALLEAAQQLGKHERLTGKLAELLTDRGVKAGNDERWADALSDLRRAIEINPHATRTRKNLITALRGMAAHHFDAGERQQARPYLEEAIRILEATLDKDRHNEEWQRTLFETRMELATVGGGRAGGELGDALAWLESLVGGEGPSEGGSSRMEVMHLMAQAGESASKKDYERALALTEQALEMEPTAPLLLRGLSSALNNRGVQLADEGEFDKAVEMLERGVRQFPDDDALQRNLRNVRQARDLMQMTSEGSGSEHLDTLLSMLARALEDEREEDTETADLPATADPRQRKALELAEQGEGEARRGDYQAAIATLEEALSLAPQETGIRRSLVDIMEKHADALIAQGKRGEGLAVARRGLMYVPDHTGLQATVAMAELMGSSDTKGPAGGLLDLLSTLAHATADGGEQPRLKSGVADPSTAETVRTCLDETGLKYQQQGDNRYILPFRTDKRGRVIVQLQAVGDLALISAPISLGSLDETAVLYSLFRATHTADIHKLCRDDDGRLSIAAEIPADVLTAESLEGLIRNAIAFVDVSDDELASADKLMAHVRAVQTARELQRGMSGGGGLLGFLRRRGDGENTAQQVPALCQQAGIDCQELRSNRFRLKFGLMELTVVAICKGKAVSFIASMGGMRPAKGHTPFYQRMAEINAAMDVCKLALDSDDDPAFMYELPALDEATFRQMHERIEAYVMRYGMELTLLT